MRKKTKLVAVPPLKSTALDALKGNLQMRVGRGESQRGSSDVGKKARVDAKTVSQWKRGEFGPNGPTVVTVEKVALDLGMSAWQILQPGHDRKAVELINVYRRASPTGRHLIDIAVSAARNDNTDQGGQQETG